MRRKCDSTGDLFAWAELRPSAVVIDAYRIFEDRTLLVVHLSTSGRLRKHNQSDVINFAVRKQEMAA